MIRHLLVPVLFFGSLAIGGTAQVQDAPNSQAKRIVYVVRHGVAQDLAPVLGQHFKDDAKIQILAEPSSNCLLISASPAALDDIIKVLDQIDRPPQVVAVELLILVLPTSGGHDAKQPSEPMKFDERQFSGPIEQVMAKIESLQKNGQIGGLKRFQFVAMENQPTSLQVGETKPYVSSANVTQRGTTNNVTYQRVGTSVELTLRVTRDNLVMMDLHAEDTGMKVPEDGVQVGTSEKGTPHRVPEVTQTTLSSRLSVPSGQAVLAQGVKTTAQSQHNQSFVIVAARVQESVSKVKPD